MISHVDAGMPPAEDGAALWLSVEPGTAPALAGYLDKMRFWSDVAVHDASDGRGAALAGGAAGRRRADRRGRRAPGRPRGRRGAARRRGRAAHAVADGGDVGRPARPAGGSGRLVGAAARGGRRPRPAWTPSRRCGWPRCARGSGSTPTTARSRTRSAGSGRRCTWRRAATAARRRSRGSPTSGARPGRWCCCTSPRATTRCPRPARRCSPPRAGARSGGSGPRSATTSWAPWRSPWSSARRRPGRADSEPATVWVADDRDEGSPGHRHHRPGLGPAGQRRAPGAGGGPPAARVSAGDAAERSSTIETGDAAERSSTMRTGLVTRAEVDAAAAVLDGVAVRTAVEPLDAVPGLLLKREDTQPIGAFKLRGAFHAASRLAPEVRAAGLVDALVGQPRPGAGLGRRTARGAGDRRRPRRRRRREGRGDGRPRRPAGAGARPTSASRPPTRSSPRPAGRSCRPTTTRTSSPARAPSGPRSPRRCPTSTGSSSRSAAAA